MKIKRFISTIIFLALLFVCGELLRFVLVNDADSYTRIMLHELYASDKNIDVLFVGSSHCYRSFDTGITDKIFRKNTFNSGTSNQQLDGSFVLIKEAAKENEIEHIYLDLYYTIAEDSPHKERSELTGTYIISDYMRPSINKFLYLLNASSKEHYINNFVVARRYWGKLFDPDYLVSTAALKLSNEYQQYSYNLSQTETEKYAGKGYVVSQKKVENGCFIRGSSFDPINTDLISDDWKTTLSDIISYCNKKGIRLTLISAPISDFRLCNVNYDSYIDEISQLIQGTQVEYIDFNLCKEAYFPCDSTLFSDNNHLSKRGAELFSTIFSKFFTGQIPKDDLFYKTYNEKLAKLSPEIFGVISAENRDQQCITITPVTNADLSNITISILRHSSDGSVVSKSAVGSLALMHYEDGDSGKFEIFTYLNGIEETHAFVDYGNQNK